MDRPDRSLPPVPSPDFPRGSTHLPAWWVDAAQRWTAPGAVSAPQAPADGPPRRWRPRVGERVVSLVERTSTAGVYVGVGTCGTLERDDESIVPFRVQFDGVDNAWIWCCKDEIGEAPAT